MEVDNTFKQNESLQNQIKSHKEENEVLQQKINDISQEYNQLQSDYDNQHITLESLQSKIQSYSEYKKDAEEKITALETTFNEQKKEIDRLNNELISKKDEINKLNQQICGEVKQTQKLLKRSETTMKSELDRQKETQKAMDLLSPSSSFSPASRADSRKSFGGNNGLDESIEQLAEISKQIDAIVRQSQDIVNEYIYIYHYINLNSFARMKRAQGDSPTEPQWSITLKSQIEGLLKSTSKLTVQLQQIKIDFQAIVRKNNLNKEIKAPVSLPVSPAGAVGGASRIKASNSTTSALSARRQLFP